MGGICVGIAVKELLALDYFKDFYVVAGRKGVYKEIQGITMFEAPDGFRWSVGKELILSSGYAIQQDPDCMRRAFEEGGFQRASAIMIKRERYLPQIPKDIMELCDRYEVPLISMPFPIPWMEVMSQVNVAVMNRTVRRFRIHNSDAIHTSQQTYKVQKIQRILQAVESEMNFPAYLYDVNEKKGYYSSANFKRISKSFDLDNAEYCVPTRPHTVHTLCDYIQMKRIRLTEPDDTGKPRISWIQIPIIMNGVVQAYFVVMESRELLDYYDEYSIRIAFLMLQAVYEQIMVTRNMGNIGFENFILYALNSSDGDRDKLIEQANVQGISMDTRYVCAVFRQINSEVSARTERKIFADAFRMENVPDIGKLVFLGENEGALLFEVDAAVIHDRSKLFRFLEEFKYKIESRLDEMRLEFGISLEAKTLPEIRSGIEKCRKVLQLGPKLDGGQFAWDYEKLGPLAWLQIPEEELESMLKKYRELMRDEKNVEVLRTLKVYLENNMNYSVTAEKLYAHINTVRKRIDKARDLLDIDWEQRINRLNVELLLQFLDL